MAVTTVGLATLAGSATACSITRSPRGVGNFAGSSRTEYDRPGSNGNRGSNWIASGVTTYRPATAAASLPVTDTRNNACQASSCHVADLSDCNSAVERPDTTMAYGPVAEAPGRASICRSVI